MTLRYDNIVDYLCSLLLVQGITFDPQSIRTIAKIINCLFSDQQISCCPKNGKMFPCGTGCRSAIRR